MMLVDLNVMSNNFYVDQYLHFLLFLFVLKTVIKLQSSHV